MAEPKRTISPERQAAYYIGMGLTAVGLLLFLSTFFSAATHTGDFSSFEAQTQSMAIRAISGMVLMMVGGITMGIGRAGPAGAGVILNPQQARRDLEPWNRAAGGMLEDTLSESTTVQHIAGQASSAPEVKVRCSSCKALNDEDAKFCKSCGMAIG
jgi:hypothetical protein